ncbi:ABA4-like family protein [Thermocrispum agreste]|jgi:hypothetical protein|uniref:ABA4-like family protein n=1 Tax=Thermocrispum agreste TaxID=37925 RepID=A0A2W4INV7_9PSEU|nr:ABA4-like family protein [Thermocrispum agreste]PZM88722.1 MAG: DUF4281 domain-containing protein [Thermocrispum agreste]
MSETMFGLAFWVTVPFWAAMIFLPRWSWTQRVIGSPLIMLPTLVVYLVLAVPVLPELWAVVSTPELAEFRGFAGGADGAALLWAQVIAWDLFIGRWIYFDGLRRGVPPWVMAPVLLLTVLLSPIAVLIWFGFRAVRPARPGHDRREYESAVGA